MVGFFGRPAGLPDSPGFHFVASRCGGVKPFGFALPLRLGAFLAVAFFFFVAVFLDFFLAAACVF